VSIFVFDSSALLRYYDNEPGADRVEAILDSCAHANGEMRISALQWGEIAAALRKRYGPVEQRIRLSTLAQLDFTVVPVDSERAVHAAAIRVDRKLPFADAFALQLAMDSSDHVLVTADYDFKVVDDLARIEFLPAK
jgi:predicted nucleic acid-binding protein